MKTVFNLVPCDNNFERDFAKFLDNAEDVTSYAKLPQPFGFSIEYTDGAMNLRSYYPDFVAVRCSQGYTGCWKRRVLRTDEVAHKDSSSAATGAKTRQSLQDVKWEYLKIPQKAFDMLQPGRLEHLVALRATSLI